VLRRDSRGTWSRESIASAPSAHLYGVFRSLIARGGAGPRAGPGNACAVGESGTVLCRDASGRWALVPTPTGETLRAGVGLFFPALGEGFADLIVGDRGTVLLR
jgi:hypothetical protein